MSRRLNLILVKWPYFGLGAIATFCLFTFFAIFFSPEPFNAINNNLSSLGDFYDNPNGALFFILGMVFTGIFALLFYIGLYQWLTNNGKKNLVTIALIAGLINSIAVILAGIFSETKETYTIHEFWSLIIFITFLPILISINVTISDNPKFSKTVVYSGFIVAVIDAIFLCLLIITGIEANTPMFEWLSVFSYLGWVGLLSYNALKENTSRKNDALFLA